MNQNNMLENLRIDVSGLYGTVKEQSSGLYAYEMDERRFLTIAFDSSFTDESGCSPRYMTDQNDLIKSMLEESRFKLIKFTQQILNEQYCFKDKNYIICKKEIADLHE